MLLQEWFLSAPDSGPVADGRIAEGARDSGHGARFRGQCEYSRCVRNLRAICHPDTLCAAWLACLLFRSRHPRTHRHAPYQQGPFLRLHAAPASSSQDGARRISGFSCSRPSRISRYCIRATTLRGARVGIADVARCASTSTSRDSGTAQGWIGQIRRSIASRPRRDQVRCTGRARRASHQGE